MVNFANLPKLILKPATKLFGCDRLSTRCANHIVRSVCVLMTLRFQVVLQGLGEVVPKGHRNNDHEPKGERHEDYGNKGHAEDGID